MAEQPVRVTYDIRGAREGAAAVDDLKRATLEHAQSAEGAGRSAEGYERAVGNVRGTVEQLRQTQENANRATAAAGQGFDQLATRGVALAQRFAGVSNAVGSLSDRLGGAGSGSSAHLVGSLAATVAQFASLGSLLGPGGAVLGGIVGLASAISNLIAEQNSGAEAARAHAAQLREVANAAREAARAVSRGRNIEFAVAEGGALGALALSDYSSEELTTEIGTRSARDAELDTERGRLEAQLATATGRGGTISGIDTGALRERIAAIDEEVEANRRVVDVLGDLIVMREREADAARGARAGTSTGAAAAGPARRGGGGRRRSGGAAEEESFDEGAFLERTGVEAEAEGLRRLAEERERAAIDATDAETERQRVKAEAADLFEADQEKRHERELERIANERRARENLDRSNMERLAQQTELLESVGDRIGGVFAGAFSAAIQGQEDFGQALAKGTKQVLIQFGTQMVAEGIGALLTGIGNTVINPPAAATKLAEGAGKIALGVGLGAAGAAIPTGGGAGSRAERPRVDQAPSSGPGASGPLVINLNAPTVLGGTDAEVGRIFGRAVGAAERRFGGLR